MTRSQQVVRMVALSGMVMMAMAGAVGASEAPAGKKATSVKPAKMKPRNTIKPAVLTLFGEPCDHNVSSGVITLDANNGDALGWWIRNKCADERVLFCVYKDEEPFDRYNPFKPCTSALTAGLNVETVFTVGSGRPELLECVGDVKGKYIKLVLTGTETNDGCPAQLPKRHDPRYPRMHRLGVEIIR
jgi:hypothetical protein